MDHRPLVILALLGVGLAVAGQARASQSADAGGNPDAPPDDTWLDAGDLLPSPESILSNVGLGDAMTSIRNTFQLWRPPALYASAIAAAEDANGIPRDILARLLYQECNWRADVISGDKRSPVGAIGIAQFMPATADDFGIDPTDPFSSIAAAGRYLGQLFQRFGNWSEALAAYNWGMGNVQRKGLSLAPIETTRYYTQILSDVNAADGTAYA